MGMVGLDVAPAPFEEVYRAHLARLYLFCLSQVRNPADAEDLTAEAFASAFAAYERACPPPDRVLPWLLTIARNAVIDHYRSAGRRATLRAVLDRHAEREAPPDVESAVLRNDEIRGLLVTMRSLRQRDRQLVGLRVAADLSYAEIGAVVGLSEHAATVATRRAVSRLRGLCEECPSRRATDEGGSA
jgi:RNA polymerase sigma factor (sigma-70 family)